MKLKTIEQIDKEFELLKTEHDKDLKEYYKIPKDDLTIELREEIQEKKWDYKLKTDKLAEQRYYLNTLIGLGYTFKKEGYMKNVKEQLREIRMMYGDLTKLKTKRKSLDNKLTHAISKQRNENSRGNLCTVQRYLDSFKVELQFDWEKITSSLMYDYNKILEFSIEDNNPENIKKQLSTIKKEIEKALEKYENDFIHIQNRYDIWK